MKYPNVRAVFDRKKQATKTETGLVQIEVMHERKRKFISTGVKVYAGQWKDKTMVTGRNDSLDLNEKISLLVGNVRGFINDLIRKKEEFTFDRLDKFLEVEQSDSFLDFMEKRIEERNMEESTRRQHLVVLKKLRDFGLIQTFSDLTTKNIKLFDDYERKFTSNQSTVHGVHKRLKVYIKESQQYEFIDKNPYDQMAVPKGEPSGRKYLTIEELHAIEKVDVQDKSISNVRDCFVFCCYTGLAYVDINSFNWERDVVEEAGKHIIRDARQKTGVPYNVTILSPAMNILKKHGFKLPMITNQQYNLRLKVLASYAKIGKTLTSHVARHTFATWALSQGISIEIVSKMLAHTDIKTTQIYAKILQKDVADSFDILEEKLSRKTDKQE